MNKMLRAAHASAVCVVAAGFVGLGTFSAAAEPDPTPVPGGPNAPTHGSLVDQPGDDGNSGSGYLPTGEGAECENGWVECGSYNNPAESDLGAANQDDGGWVDAPSGVGGECENEGVVCSDVA